MRDTVEARIDRPTIQAVARLIVERFDPEQVILFGSHARGQAGVHSDVDLLVVMRGESEAGRGNPVRRAIAERFVLPVDVIIWSPDALAQQCQNPTSWIHKALEEGEVLYERPAA